MSDRANRYQARSVNRHAEGRGGRTTSRDALRETPSSSTNIIAVRVNPVIPTQVIPVKMPPSFRIKYIRFKGDGSQDVDD
ncbi:unnamed protein product [Calypogeia fissa]